MMKKLLALLLALAMVLSLAACGNKDNTANTQNDQSQAESTTPTNKENTTEPPSDNQEEDKEEADQGAENSKEEAQKPQEHPKEEEKKPEAVITASHSDVTFKAAGDSFKLTASPLPANATITYASEDESIATVAEDGTVTAVAPGTTNVSLHIEEAGVASYDYTCIIRCNWKEGGSAASGVDLNAYYSSFMSSLGEGNAPFMVEMAEDLMDAYYPGLTAIERKQTVMQMDGMGVIGFEFSLVECVNAADIETVKSIFQARKDYQIDGGAFYPASIEAWEKAEIIVSGNIVALINAGDVQQSAVDAFHTACGK